MNEYVWETCVELDKKIADRVRLIRKRRSISQEKLSKISNVSLGSIKRFETTLPEKYKLAEGECILNAVIFNIDDTTSKVTDIKRIYIR